MNEYIREAGTLLFTLESQFKNAEGTMELEKSPLANLIIIGSGKNH